MAESRQEHKEGGAASDAVAAILARKWLIAAVALLGGVGTYIFSKTALAPTYEAQGTVFVQEQSGPASLLRQFPVALMGRGSDNSGYLMTVLQSDTMVRRVCRQLDLVHDKNFNGGGLSQELTERALKRGTSVKQDKNGAVTVSVQTRNPELCAKIINHMLDNLSELYVSNSKRQSTFLDEKLAQTGKQLAAAEDAMVAFQNAHNLAMIDEQTKAAVAALGELDGALTTQKVELEQVQVELDNGGDVEELVRLRVRKKALESSIAVINGKIDSIRKTLEMVPSVAIQYARLRRKVAVFTKAMEILTEQVGIATITRHGEDGDYRVVDWAQIKREPVGPRSAVNAAIGTAFFGFVAMAMVLARRSAAGTKRRGESGSPEAGGAQV